ncbi:hypothetical protein N7509_013167 [Penicillium cosmopolitanum]|uniref:Uncharacterized protein n=1 Tax=Penicillium cosmopolitanum TaxID=1131564 RepID=A0A9W9SCU9_9EURO|nr:uncharacterized protein N7509_013167 [Penicillium cosmopolitanum]KAJ5376281.1 hypothetical protein N7509_013167 [Penicillium cosmopolitanum]
MASPHKDDARGCPVNNQEVQNSSVSIFTTINSTSPNSTITTSNTNSTINISSGATGQGFPVNAHDHTQSAELNETHGHGDAVRMEVRGQNGNPIIEDFDLDELNLHLPRNIQMSFETEANCAKIGPIPRGGVLGMDGWRRSEPRSAMVRLILFHTRTTNQAIKTLIKPLKTVDEVMALDAATPDPSKKEESTEAI